MQTITTLRPTQVRKQEFRLATVRMPDSPDLKEGERNELEISLRYMKDGMHRQGRGIYLVATGCTTDGVIKSHLLMQDPSLYVVVEGCRRFSAKRLAELAANIPAALRATIDEQAERARTYYAAKGRE